MRQPSSMILIAMFLALSLPALAFAQTSAINSTQAQAELTAVHAQLSAAIESGDSPRVLSFCAPNFTMRLRNGKVLTLDDMAQLRRLAEAPQVSERKHSTVIQKFKLVGAEAIISVDHSGYTSYKLEDGSVRRIVEVVRQQERWIKHADDWKLSVIEGIESKQRDVTLNGQTEKTFMPGHAVPIEPNADDQKVLNDGYGIVFIYRMNDGTIIKPPIYCNDEKAAQMTGGSFLKLKLRPGKYSLKSDKGDPVEVNVEASKISFLQLKMDAGFPKARGVLQLDKSIIAAEAYKLPRLLDLTPLGSDNIVDPSKVVVK
jgi:hypothetical protein